MIRYLKELFKPSLKCKRVGHEMIEFEIKIMKEGGPFHWYVASDYKAKQNHCKRCGGEHSEPYDLEHIKSYNGVTMGSDRWTKMRERGYIITN